MMVLGAFGARPLLAGKKSVATNMESGSETETDDELFERLEHAHDADDHACASPRPDAPSLSTGSPEVVLSDAVSARDQPAIQQAQVCEEEAHATTAAVVTNASWQPPLSVSSLGSDSDDQARLQKTASSAQSHQQRPSTSSAQTKVKTVALPSLWLFRPSAPPPVQIGTSTNAALVAIKASSKQEEVGSKPQPAQKPQHQPIQAPKRKTPVVKKTAPAATKAASRPVAHQTPVVISHQSPPVPAAVISVELPTAGEFQSPFSSLTTQYQAPTQPGANPLPDSQAHPADLPLSLATATILCSKCTIPLTENASPIPLEGHGECTCCGRYYPYLIVKQNERLCESCGPAISVILAAQATPSPLPTLVCATCERTLVHCPPTTGGTECKCCLVRYHKSAFSNNQLRYGSRRCKACVCGRGEKELLSDQEAAERGKRRRREKQARRYANRLAREKAAMSEEGGASEAPVMAVTDTSPITVKLEAVNESGMPPEVSRSSQQQRQEMEAAIRKIKLARRSIHLRRRAKDLQGSMQVGYEVRPCMEEDTLNTKMINLRRGNPVLFDWVNQIVEAKDAQDVATSEQHASGQVQLNLSNEEKKRREGDEEKDAHSAAKRARVEPPPTDVKQEIKSEDHANEAPRAQRAAPVEIVDLVDSD